MHEHNPHNIPLAYLITFTCYGTWLHGDARGSVDGAHNQFGTPFLTEDYCKRPLAHSPVVLSPEQRKNVTESLIEACSFRHWKLWEVNVRSNHVHVVLSSEELPKEIMRKLKSRCTTSLKGAGLFDGKRLWTEGGSGRYLWTESAVESACRYVREQ